MAPLRLSLLLRLWKVEPRCWTLQKAALLEPMPEAQSVEGTGAASLALEGIAVLCREGVIDMRTTVEVLEPRCTVDSQPRVLCSFVRLLALAPSFNVAAPEYQHFLSSRLSWLWGLAGAVEQPEGVREAAFRAIATWPSEATSLAMLPTECKAGLKMPARF